MRARRLRTPRAADVAGVLFSALLVASVILGSWTPGNLSDAETVQWFLPYAIAYRTRVFSRWAAMTAYGQS